MWWCSNVTGGLFFIRDLNIEEYEETESESLDRYETGLLFYFTILLYKFLSFKVSPNTTNASPSSHVTSLTPLPTI